MFNVDKPINTIEEDKNGLNRANFAHNLSENIKNHFEDDENNDCLVIGLMGEWGSGKTSLLNLTKQNLKNSNIKIIEFNPWLYSSYNQLVEQFLDELINEIKNPGLKGELQKYLLKINKLNLAKTIATVSIDTISAIATSGIINNTLGKIIDSTIKSDSEETNLNKIKENVNEKIKNYPILCILDDIDRLRKEEIIELFKLIKIMADFNNMVYLLSFDKSIVSEALDDDHINGEQYIKKIINVPLTIPSITTAEIKKIFLKKIEHIQRKHNISNYSRSRLNLFLDFTENQSSEEYGIIYFFKNIRDIKRYFNILEFNIELIKDEVNFVDFIVITAIQVFHQDAYNKIKYSEYLLTVDNYIYDKKKDEELIKMEINEFERITNNDSNLKAIMKRLFKKMKYLYTDTYYKNSNNKDEKELLIQHPDNFRTYFKLNETAKKLPEFEIDQIIRIINSKDESALSMAFTRLYKNQTLDLFLSKLINRDEKIYKNIFLLKFLLTINKKKIPGIIFPNDNITLIILNIIYRITAKDRFNKLEELYNKTDNIILLYDIVDYIEQSNFDPNTNETPILSKTNINNLKEIIKSKYNESDTKTIKLSSTELSAFLYMGKKLNMQQKNETIIEQLIRTSDGILQLLQAYIPFTKKETLLKNGVNSLNEYIDVNKIYNIVNNENFNLKNNLYVECFLKGYKLWNEK